MMRYNRQFVESRSYEQYHTSKYPDKKIAIVTCMDTRLVELIPAALGIKNGDVKIIKNAGGTITNPFDSTVRSLLVACGNNGRHDQRLHGGSHPLQHFRLRKRNFRRNHNGGCILGFVL